MKPSLDIVVVNWNSGDHLRECIRAIADTDRSGIDVQRVVVVDNDSEDGSDLDLDLDVPGITLELVRNHRNLGFATACNQGAQGGRSDYVLFLNPDVSVASNALKAPIEWMERAEQSTVGICGIRLLDGEGALQPSCSRFPSTMTTLATILGLDRMPRRPFRGTLMREWHHDETRVVDQVMGAYFLARRPVFERLGGFDERYFLYYEEVDFARRALFAGWRSAFYASATATHVGGACSRRVLDRRIFHSQWSRSLYARRHLGRAAAATVLLASLFVEPLTRSALAARRGSSRDLMDAWRANGRLWRMVPSLRDPTRADPWPDHPIRVVRVLSRVVIGGPAHHTVLLSRALNDGEFRTTLVGGAHQPEEQDLIANARRHGVETEVMPRMARAIRPLDDLRSLVDLYRLIRRRRPHVVHTHTAKAGALGRVAAWLAGVPCIVHTFHGHVFEGYFGPVRSRLAVWAERALARLSTRIVVISRRQRDDIRDRFRIAPSGRIALIPLGKDWDHFFAKRPAAGLRERLGIPQDRALIAIVGRLVPIKNHRLFVEIARRLQSADPDRYHFLIVGDGELKSGIQSLIHGHGLDHIFTFTGWLELNHAVYREIDLVLCTSHNEGTPLSLIEAIAAGVPVVSRDVGGVGDVMRRAGLDGPVDSADPEAFLEPIKRALGDPVPPEARRRTRDAHDGARLVDDIRALYRECLGRGPHGTGRSLRRDGPPVGCAEPPSNTPNPSVEGR
jgi:GT2 family glycosyltransferase/glycosyltransferase involved in cell wall biosynthesis